MFIIFFLEAQNTSPTDIKILMENYNSIWSSDPQNLSVCISPVSSTLPFKLDSQELDSEGIFEFNTHTHILNT